MNKLVQFRMNGVRNAFLRELGCLHCPQCGEEKPRANTSGSLLVYEAGTYRRRLETHWLFDCGSGVVDSLIDFGATKVSRIFISHAHSDHSLELHRLTGSLKRSGASLPIDLHCTETTWRTGPGQMFPYLHDASSENNRVRPCFVKSGQPVQTGDDCGIALRVTPLSVWHGNRVHDPAIWVVEFGSHGSLEYRKIVLAWDMLHLVPRYPGEDADQHFPNHSSTVVAGNELLAEHSLLKNADELFIECNTCQPHPETGHTSLAAILRFYVPVLKPRRTWLVHYSGHEDDHGPLADDDLQRHVETRRRELQIETPIHVARHGMALQWLVSN